MGRFPCKKSLPLPILTLVQQAFCLVKPKFGVWCMRCSGNIAPTSQSDDIFIFVVQKYHGGHSVAPRECSFFNGGHTVDARWHGVHRLKVLYNTLSGGHRATVVHRWKTHIREVPPSDHRGTFGPQIWIYHHFGRRARCYLSTALIIPQIWPL